MKYKIKPWTIAELLKSHSEGKLNLNPPYQRNDIWTTKAQADLITSIKEGMPIPNFFLHEQTNNKYDVADGQQRTRAILAYIKGEIADNNGIVFNNETDFLNYLLAVLIIDKSVSQEKIREFYVKVNNTGLRVNSPELTKAQYFNSKILKFVDELSSMPIVDKLNLFSEKQQVRMIDREFIEELIALCRFGPTDKKSGIKRLYEEGDSITVTELKTYKVQFINVFIRLNVLQRITPLIETRYSQKNDLYTLYNFILNNPKLKIQSLKIFYNLLTKIEDDISPSNEKCEPLQEYAVNCVTQSNSKSAKERRLEIINEILLNEKPKPNKTQRMLIKYYQLKEADLVKVEKYFTLPSKNIVTKFVFEG